MRKLSVFIVFAALVVAGCDSSSNNGDSESQSVVQKLSSRSWSLTGVSDADGDQFSSFSAAFTSVTVTFTATTFTIGVVAVDPAGNTTITGDYSLDEAAKRLTLSAEVAGIGTVPLVFTYNFKNNDTVVDFTADATTSTLLNTLFGTTLTGNATLTLSRS